MKFFLVCIFFYIKILEILWCRYLFFWNFFFLRNSFNKYLKNKIEKKQYFSFINRLSDIKSVIYLTKKKLCCEIKKRNLVAKKKFCCEILFTKFTCLKSLKKHMTFLIFKTIFRKRFQILRHISYFFHKMWSDNI